MIRNVLAFKYENVIKHPISIKISAPKLNSITKQIARKVLKKQNNRKKY
jgi:hypothetical protein